MAHAVHIHGSYALEKNRRSAGKNTINFQKMKNAGNFFKNVIIILYRKMVFIFKD